MALTVVCSRVRMAAQSSCLMHFSVGMIFWSVRHWVATMGALRLYLDFINLFLHLLRILGSRN